MMKSNKILNIKNALSRFLLLATFMLAIGGLHAQNNNLTVQGTVISSEDGLPIPGVSVVIKGSTIGTITDIDGNYSISAALNDVLQFSFIGMKPIEKTVESNKLNVSLESDVVSLDEVVAIGYGTLRKKEVTGAVTQVKSEDIIKHVTSDIGMALQGQVAGVNVVASSGEPGASSNIQIRGVSSIGGDNTPLFVVDGIPQEGDPRLSSNEIETIDILKDAASCAVYGTRGAAGVILITTKTGQKGAMKVRVDGSYGIQHITSGTPLMTTNEQLYYEAIENRNAEPLYPTDIAGKYPHWLTNETNIVDMMQVDNAATQNYNVTFSGGTENLVASAVFGFFDQDGVIINSNFRRYNGRINTKFTKNRLTVAASINFSLEDQQKPVGNMLTQAFRYLPYFPAVDASTSEIDATGGNRTKMDNVLQAIKKEDFNKRDRLNANVNLDYKITNDLKFISKIGTGVTSNHGRQFVPFYTVYDQGIPDVDPTKSYSYIRRNRATSFSFEGALSYIKKINKVHTVRALVNYSVEERTFDDIYGSKQGITNNNITVINGGTVNPTIFSGNNYTSKLLGTLGRVQYDYKGRYLFSASVRRDGSSKFSESNRWGVFPSASVGWNVADEKFWSGLTDIANSFKIRASYGTTGNERIGNYLYSGAISQNIDYSYGTGQADILALGTAQLSYPNADVKWETSIQSNIGVDLGFFENRLTLTADYYNTEKVDMLFPVRLPSSAGVGLKGDADVTLNVGDMVNRGVELALLYRGRTGQVNWNVGATYTTNHNEVTKMSGGSDVIVNPNSVLLSGDPYSTVTAIMLGHEAGAFFLNPTDGVIKTAEQLTKYQELRSDAKMGDLMYRDTNNDGKISDEDRVYSGSGLPDYELGLNFGLDYKSFDFSMNWYAAVGNDIMNGGKAAAYSFETHKDLVYMWSDVNPNSDIPLFRGTSKEHDNYRAYTDFWLEDGSYVRLRNVTLGYTLPKSLSMKAGISNCRFYLTAQNPLTFTKYTGYDPEIGGNVATRGLDKGNYPVSSTYSIGINLDF